MDASSCGCVLPNNIPGYDGVSVQTAARRGGRRVQARFSRRETHLLVLFAVVLQQACCDGKGFRTELAVPCYAFTMQESSKKMIKRRTRKRTSGSRFLSGQCRVGTWFAAASPVQPGQWAPFAVGKTESAPSVLGKRRRVGTLEILVHCRAEAYFCVRPSLKHETVRPQSSQNSKGIYNGGFPAFAAPLRKAQNESGGFPCVN